MIDAPEDLSPEDLSPEETLAWAKGRLDEAVREITQTGVVQGAMLEARVVWALPKKMLIGQLRDSGGEHREFWIIAGDLPTDCVDAETCATPRDAAKHFALKWQLEASQARDPEVRRQRGLNQDLDWDSVSDRLASMAEVLYAVAAEDKAWRQVDVDD